MHFKTIFHVVPFCMLQRNSCRTNVQLQSILAENVAVTNAFVKGCHRLQILSNDLSYVFL